MRPQPTNASLKASVVIDAIGPCNYNDAMSWTLTRRQILVSLLILMPSAATAAEDLFYETDVRPILKAHCFHCHGEEEEHQASLDLRLVRTMLAGGDSGAAIVAGNAKYAKKAEKSADKDEK